MTLQNKSLEKIKKSIEIDSEEEWAIREREEQDERLENMYQVELDRRADE
jgi:hypothetical protein